MPDLIITDELVERCALAALNASRLRTFGARPLASLDDALPDIVDGVRHIARAILEEALR